LQQNNDLLPFVYEKCVSSADVILESASLSSELLKTTLKSLEKAYVILDGLDECDKEERKKILSWFTSNITAVDGDNPGTLRGLFISQDEGDIRKLLSNASEIRLTAEDNQKDINSFASEWSSRICTKFDLPDNRATEIAHTVSDRAKGNTTRCHHQGEADIRTAKECFSLRN
jgi:hypothetical protein